MEDKRSAPGTISRLPSFTMSAPTMLFLTMFMAVNRKAVLSASAAGATTATRWATPRTITLGGDLSGSTTIDGSANVTINATIGANTVSLGTDTVGTYVSKAQASGWGISDGSSNSGIPATEVERGVFEFTLASTSTSIANTLVFRNGSGNFNANVITATATQARYADLAENYVSDAVYDAGTVLMLGGIAEVTICNTYESENVLGVVSTNPAYLMNSELENGVAIALKGRVPVKVTGTIKKGDILVSSNVPGHAQTRRNGHRTNPWAVIGQALQDFDGDTGIIEMFVL